MSTTALFGEWLACTDGKAHYHLDGSDNAALCGCVRRCTGARVWVEKAGNWTKLAVPYCADCKRLNEARWLNGGALPHGSAQS